MVLPAVEAISNGEIWKTLLTEIPSFTRTKIERTINAPDPPPFFEFVVEALEKDAATGKPGELSSLLMDSTLVLRVVSDPAMLPLAEAIRLARAAARLDSRLDDKILRRLTDSARKWPDAVPEAEMLHVLEVIDAISDCQRLVIPLMKFAKLRSKELRSKAVKLMGRSNRNAGWVETILSDADPRIRSNLIEGIAAQNWDNADALLRKATHDPHHRVAVTALLALCRSGDQQSCEAIRQLSVDGDPNFKMAAEWALKELQKPPDSASDGRT